MKYPRVVYALRHNPTGRVYVGSTYDLTMRVYQHIYKLRNGTHPIENMQRDFYQHGEDYTLYILDTLRDYCDNRKEFMWMDILDTRNQDVGYNYSDHSKKTSLDLFKGIRLPTKMDRAKEFIRDAQRLALL
ncbi:MAG: GIY-YIG nuclease family protein [Bacteroidales bacterium]|nr:GIY-YIG nuclease family protein [Bacteroidales bacterium]